MITKITASDYIPGFAEGEIILIDKPLINTSFDVVYKVRKATGIKKVGHAGTLDPLATGLLIVCTGKKTKEISSLQGLEKTYTGIISLGKTTPSFDMETGFENEKDLTGINETNILDVRNTFLGSSLQTPPMYSAVKKNGKALYKYARKGLEIERKKREIVISSFEITKVEMPDVHFEIKCSAGTYIRVIAHEFGQKLGCGAYLKCLRRTMIGEFNVDEAFDIKEFIEYANKFSDAA